MKLKWIVVLIIIVAVAPNAIATVCADAVHATVSAVDSMVTSHTGPTSG